MRNALISKSIKRASIVKSIKKVELTNKITEYKKIGSINNALELQKVLISSIRRDKLNKCYSSSIYIDEEIEIIIKKYYYNIIE